MIIVTKFVRTCCGQATVRGNSSKAHGPLRSSVWRPPTSWSGKLPFTLYIAVHVSANGTNPKCLPIRFIAAPGAWADDNGDVAGLADDHCCNRTGCAGV